VIICIFLSVEILASFSAASMASPAFAEKHVPPKHVDQ
jgi:hypothetical protein